MDTMLSWWEANVIQNWTELQTLIAGKPTLKISVKVCMVIGNRLQNKPPGILFVLNPGKRVETGTGYFIRGEGWGNPGGSMLDNETMFSSVQSETKEETGLEIDPPTEKDFLCAIQTTPDHVKVYFNIAPPKYGKLTVKNDVITPHPVKEFKIVPFAELDRLLEMRSCHLPATICDKTGRPFRVFNDDLAVAWIRKELLLNSNI